MEPHRLDIPPLHVRAEIATRLAAMGLTEEFLTEATSYAYAEKDRCTGNDARAAGGYAVWTKLLRFMRDGLLPKGWAKGGLPNLESVIHPSRSFQIVPSSGNWATGDPDRMPATRHLKGRRTQEVIADNGQFALDVVGSTLEAKPEIKTFFFLTYEDEDKEEIRHELAIPTHMTIGPKAKKGRIDEFGSRIILTPVKLDADTDLDEEHEEEFSDDLDISVERRTSL
jgi:hypothetical protein